MSEIDETSSPFVRGQVLRRSDLHVAVALARLGGDHSTDVLLAAAMAARAPRHGHVCVELDRVAEQVEPVIEEGEDPVTLSWPELGAWLHGLRDSALVRAPDQPVATPLVLDGARLYLDRYWGYQERLLTRLRALVHAPEIQVDVAVVRAGLEAWFEPSGDGRIDRQQLAALIALLRRLTVISGGPGTGKTTTITRILALLLTQAQARGEGLRIALAAPTGKAANRVKESVETELRRLNLPERVADELARVPSFTLHRLLGYRSDNPTRFRHHADAPLPYDVVVVDEASMVSFAMMAKLVDAVSDRARLILLGDRDQLTSVEAGAVLGDICSPHGGELCFSRTFAARVTEVAGLELAPHATLVQDPGIWDCMVQLDRFHRFGEASGIGGVARAVQRNQPTQVIRYLRGRESEGGPAYTDVDLVDPDEAGSLPDSCRRRVVEGYRRFIEIALASRTGEDALDALEDLRVLCAHRRGRSGVESLNARIEQWLEGEVEGFAADRVWYAGRPVMVTENDYGLRLFNGDVGVVLIVDGRRVVAFRKHGGGIRLLGPARLPPCETVFAMSIHKSQGSQFGHAIVVLPAEPSRIVTRELVYTGITRARTRLTLVASEAGLEAAVGTPVRRASGLRDELWPAEGPAHGDATAEKARAGTQLDLFRR